MSKKQKSPQGTPAIEEINTRLGGLFGALTEALKKIEVSTAEHGSREATAPDRHGPVRVSADIRLSSLSETRERTRHPARQKRERAKPRSRERKNRASEVCPIGPIEQHDEPGLWCITVEIPGLSEHDISIEAVGSDLFLVAHQGRVRLPAPAGLKPSDCALHGSNGFLEISAPWPPNPASETGDDR